MGWRPAASQLRQLPTPQNKSSERRRHISGLLYQPTTELLWTFARAINDPRAQGHAYYVRAKAMLADVNETFKVKAQKIGMCEPGKKTYRLLLPEGNSIEPAACLCNEYQTAPYWSPRSMDGKRGHNNCVHTLAWNAYAAILNDHWRNLRQDAPMLFQQHEYWTGSMYKISDWATLIAFSQWLSGHASLVLHSTNIVHVSHQPTARRH
jgi:hypothetical protein